MKTSPSPLPPAQIRLGFMPLASLVLSHAGVPEEAQPKVLRVLKEGARWVWLTGSACSDEWI